MSTSFTIYGGKACLTVFKNGDLKIETDDSSTVILVKKDEEISSPDKKEIPSSEKKVEEDPVDTEIEQKARSKFVKAWISSPLKQGYHLAHNCISTKTMLEQGTVSEYQNGGLHCCKNCALVYL